MIVDMISDLHGYYPILEGGDLLIVAGDLTARDTEENTQDFIKWIMSYFHKYKKSVFIAGNHDNLAYHNNHKLFQGYQQNNWLTYLCDSGTEFEGLKIWGSPWTKTFPDINEKCMAFTCDTDEELAEKWKLIPDDTDILITHGPSMLMHDQCIDRNRAGSRSLLTWTADRYNTLRLHVCGHIHEGYGIWDERKLQKEINGKEGTVYVNCSHVNEHYEPVNKPIRVIL